MTTITVNPNAPMSAAAGQPYAHTTHDGQTMHGVTEVNAEDRLIVRFPDGRWAFASFEYATGWGRCEHGSYAPCYVCGEHDGNA